MSARQRYSVSVMERASTLKPEGRALASPFTLGNPVTQGAIVSVPVIFGQVPNCANHYTQAQNTNIDLARHKVSEHPLTISRHTGIMAAATSTFFGTTLPTTRNAKLGSAGGDRICAQ